MVVRALLLGFLLASVSSPGSSLNAGALVLVNSQSPDYGDFRNYLEPYLTHFGLPYEVRDISASGASPNIETFALVIVGHRALDPPRRFLSQDDERRLLAGLRAGTGLVSFDGSLAGWEGNRPRELYSFPREIFGLRFAPSAQASAITVAGEHFITGRSPVPRTVALKRPMTVPAITAGAGATILARAGDQPLLIAAEYGRGRAVLFTSAEWTRPDVKGKLYGLDDLVWRSLVWAARKPFFLRGMPPFLTVRIDDVSGFGLGANRHLGYVAALNRRGLKPRLGLFIDDLREDPTALETLARLTREGLATASVHARRWSSFFYLDEPLLKDEGGRNITGRPWPREKMSANFDEANVFLAEHHIVPSKVAIPHFYEFAVNNFDRLAASGAEFVSTVLTPGYGYGTLMPQAGPYLSGESPRPSDSKDPVYLADWLKVPGRPEFDRRFFNFVIEVRDVAGYEWAPSGVPVEEAVRRGVEESRREFDSLAPAVLFTHESDHIRHIQPEDWDRIVDGVMEQLRPYKPVPVTLDYLMQYMRALKTSRISAARYDPSAGRAGLDFEGVADLSTRFYRYDDSPACAEGCEMEAPAFRDKLSQNWAAR